jgi:hypothetical protein
MLGQNYILSSPGKSAVSTLETLIELISQEYESMRMRNPTFEGATPLVHQFRKVLENYTDSLSERAFSRSGWMTSSEDRAAYLLLEAEAALAQENMNRVSQGKKYTARPAKATSLADAMRMLNSGGIPADTLEYLANQMKPWLTSLGFTSLADAMANVDNWPDEDEIAAPKAA